MKTKPKGIDVALMRHLYEYKDGRVITKVARKRKPIGSFASDEIGDTKGYRRISLKRCVYKEHRVVWSLFHDTIPEILDHIDGDVKNNRIENLRASNHRLNRYNNKAVKNISYHKKLGVWFCNIRYKGKLQHLGTYKDKELAEFVAQEARLKWVEPLFDEV